MCLSIVYALCGDEKKQLCKNVAAVSMKGDKIICTDIMGITTEIDATIEKIDLMDNFIYVKEHMKNE